MTSADLTTPLVYVECDVPEGMTLSAWRTARHEADARVDASWRAAAVRLARRPRA